MSYNYDYDMKYTDNPYIDLLVHNTKIMGINSVVKNEREALKYETLESRSASNNMISYKQGYPVDSNFMPSEYVEMNRYYRMLSGQPPFPTSAEISAYQEEYGKLANLTPLYSSKYIPLDEYQNYISNSNYLDITGRFLHEFTNDTTVISMLESFGIMDQIKIDYPGDDFKYIYHLGEKAIDPYTARTAENFSLLYVPTIPFEDIFNKYKRVFDKNRQYTISVIYSEAYAYGSIHYDNFIMILIILQTMIDMISEVQEYIINKDVFDSRTIRYLFESYGIEYYKEIPVKYQLAMIKNVNTLLKYKSTNRNIVDICSLFGFPDIGVFTYYLLKTKKIPKEDFSFYTEEDINPKYLNNITYYLQSTKPVNNRYPLMNRSRSIEDDIIGWVDSGIILSQVPEGESINIGMPILLTNTIPIYNEATISSIVTSDMIGTEKFVDNYDLKFLRVPILEPNASDYMNDMAARRAYDYITNQDPFWDGVSKADILTEEEKSKYHLQKKTEILNKEFSCERTKYISVDASIDVCKMSYQICYFMNILYDKHFDEEKLMLDVDSNMFDSGNTRVRLNDIMTLAIALGYLYNGVEPDMIAADMERNMTINGFNFDTDWNDIYDNLNNNIFIRDEDGDKVKISGYGSLVELESSIDTTDTYEVGAFLSGRYKNDSGDYESIIWDNIQNYKIFDIYSNYPSYTFNGYHDLDYPTYLDAALRLGAYDENRIGVEDGLNYHIIDLTWDTPYDPDQNSHGNFINTDVLNVLEDSVSDLDRFNKLKEIYTTNTNLYNHLTYMMRHAESKRMYDIYNTLFESFMETKLCHEFYNIRDNDGNLVYINPIDNIKWLYNNSTEYYNNVGETTLTPNGYYYNTSNDNIILAELDTEGVPIPPSSSGLQPKIADDYYEYLQSRNPDIGGVLWKAWHGFKSKDEQKSYISKICDYIVYALEKYFDSNEWKYIYNLIPTRNLEFIQKCILKVVIFFKSWKTQILGQTVEYIFDDPYHNHVHILDDIILSAMHELYEKLGPRDFHDFLIHKSPREKIEITEKIGIDTFYVQPWIFDLLCNEKVTSLEFIETLISTSYNDSINILDRIDLNIVYSAHVLTASDFVYYIQNDEVTLVKYLSDNSGYTSVVIPTTIDGYPITSIDPSCFTSTHILNIEIPEGIEYIL